MSSLYEKIDNLCKERNTNVTEMCRHADIPRSNLSELKRGKSKMLSTPTLKKITDYFNISLEELLGWDRPIDEWDMKTLELFPDFVPGKGYLPTKEDTPAAEAPEVSDLDNEILKIVLSLPENDKEKVRDYIDYLKSKQNP